VSARGLFDVLSAEQQPQQPPKGDVLLVAYGGASGCLRIHALDAVGLLVRKTI
jgi:hypothetical protein